MPERDPRPFQRVLVTGAAGFIGSTLVDTCLARGADVVGLDNLDDYYDPALKRANLAGAADHPGFRLVEGDIRDAALVRRLVEDGGFDVVVHLAARAGVRPSIAQPGLYADVNVQGTVSVLEALRARPGTRLVFASSSSVYGGLTRIPFAEDDEASRPVSPYAATKKAGEVLCHTWHHLYGLPVTVLRFFTAYGPRQRPDMAIAKFARLIRGGEPVPMFGDGDTARDYTYIGDIVDGVVRAMERTETYHVYNLGESRTTRLRDLVRLLGEALGVEPRIDRHPMQPGDVEITCADVTRACDEIGYAPSTPIEAGLERYAEWLARTGPDVALAGR
ncbi:MAG: NAD-dependent epimerase/dehydratase family protein [Actinomycetota bacterium]